MYACYIKPSPAAELNRDFLLFQERHAAVIEWSLCCHTTQESHEPREPGLLFVTSVPPSLCVRSIDCYTSCQAPTMPPDTNKFITPSPRVLTLAYPVFRPSFRRAMETPNQTPAGLIDACDEQTMTWPADGASVIYVRVYAQLDAEQTDRDNAGVYVGWTLHAPRRDRMHGKEADKSARVTDRRSHYDIAREAGSCNVLIALHQHESETMGTGGAGYPIAVNKRYADVNRPTRCLGDISPNTWPFGRRTPSAFAQLTQNAHFCCCNSAR